MVYTSSGVALSAVPIADASLFHSAVSSRRRRRPAGGQRVELGLALVLALAPFGGDQALVLEAIERRVERALRHAQRFARNLLDAQQHAVAVERLQRHRFQNQHVERSGQQLSVLGHVVGPLLAWLGV